MSAQQRPTYEGRPLPRPDDELVDQGLSFDIGTLLSRRRMLKAFGLGAATLGLTACGVSTTASSGSSSGSSLGSTVSGSAAAGTLAEIPDETNGPYPGDGTNGPDVLEESGIVRKDIRSSFGNSITTAEGIPMTLRLNVYDIEGGRQVPDEGVAVYVWHCDRDGHYSMYSSGIKDENYLRGVQIADANGVVEFETIFPACYQGRWPHVHIEVYPDEASIADHDTTICTTQLAFPKDVCDTVYATAGYEASIKTFGRFTQLSDDDIFGDSSNQTATLTGDVASGYLAVLDIGIDPTTAATAGGGGGAGGPGGGGGTPPLGGQGGPGGAGIPPSGGMGTPPSGGAAPTTAASG